MLYTSAYKGDAYNPALNMYYLQDKTTIGNYPYFDFFANLKMKHTRFFLKYQHANAGYMRYRYYIVPGYPQMMLPLNLVSPGSSTIKNL